MYQLFEMKIGILNDNLFEWFHFAYANSFFYKKNRANSFQFRYFKVSSTQSFKTNLNVAFKIVNHLLG